MNREIELRAKTLDGRWIYSTDIAYQTTWLGKGTERKCFMREGCTFDTPLQIKDFVEVDPETVNQKLPYETIDNEPIFEGDILQSVLFLDCICSWGSDLTDKLPHRRIVTWNKDRFEFTYADKNVQDTLDNESASGASLCDYSCSRCTIIGNKFDNPELMIGTKIQDALEWKLEIRSEE